MDTNVCAPRKVGSTTNGCFDKEALIRIAEDYNKKYPQKKIIYKPNIAPAQLWDLIRDSLAEKCGDDELCWVDQEFMKRDVDIQKYYKPIKPAGQTQWLATSDINNVLKQYEQKYDDFSFMGTVPIDFATIIEEYKNMDFCSLYKGKGLHLRNKTTYNNKPIRRFGFVFNLDPHDQRGSHWVSMFLDLTCKTPFIGYFDSYGFVPIPKEIDEFMDGLILAVKNCIRMTITKRINTIRHQHKNTECGVYSLYFVYNCLIGRTFDDITEDIILDDAVNKWRDRFFRPRSDFGDNSNDNL